ncbi:hypothetical protein IA01_08245 [Flavobacterium psychrophilum]|jgi:hypothetical protein|uniref:DUF1573 domain-containing protein n=2 Tax=Flavobacterium psychrophilum TaxID=96345 RepID=A6H091_FLAPJ|nr:DUF1573 domain-containing protein [Flavobacterium psychrophilum]AIG30453.1 hypothetical protein IA03_08220 [Flavobacterium psychrophilum]AIG32728.1 hypothetical protein IA01_08245 [Flavobacterium psychrophilum]AIG34883.1 hypothetical protein IA02_07630 [Flavobacterium psychrophilum]AIG37248.1 hypothetical protein IA04_08155 [Flavobacterium psychrophilum]AIG39512.1 hypothetical protein IA05_08220 [Flavobacterium psychrophilum]
MRNFFAIILVFTFGFLSHAQSGAKIEFTAKDNTIDYGTVSKNDDSGIRSFEFTNTGNEPLIIKEVKSSCGCTVPTKPTDPILPGKMGKIDVKYNMNPGPIRKTITVESNAINYEGGMVPLKIKGTVVAPEEVNMMEKKKSLPSN